jgi:pimeloyl-ACP methyl ester carboxylesterase
MRQSSIITQRDSAGEYQVEIFDNAAPKRVIICAHGNGVRRWDGEKFFYAVAEHYADSTVMLVDQNQPDGDGCRLNPLPILVSRVEGLLARAKNLHPDTPIVIMGHSMGCAVVSFIQDLAGVKSIVFVTPGAGNQEQALIERYGPDVVHGKAVTTSDNLRKVIPAEYVQSVKGKVWEDTYADLLSRFQPVYCFEAGNEEIVGDDRLAHRTMPFAKYDIIPGAKHNLTGQPLQDFFGRLDLLIS